MTKEIDSINEHLTKINSGFIVVDLIKSLDELMAQDFVYVHGRVTHHGWFQSWQIRFAKCEIGRGRVFKVKKRENNNE